MVITPQTDVYLLKVPLEIDEINQLTFANASSQFNYFNSLPKLGVDNFTYQRKDGIIRFPAHFDDLVNYNYVMYRNEAYSNKWFYAFISGMDYLNDSTTAISIKTDVWQTWQFDLTFRRMFVEREHVNDDSVGANTIDEGLELGDYVINTSTTIKPNLTVLDNQGDPINGLKYPIFFQVTELASGIGIASSLFDNGYNGLFSGLKYFAVTSYSAARSIITRYDSQGKGDAIVALFLAPVEFLSGAAVFGELGYKIYIPQDTGRPTNLINTTTITRPSSLNGYTPTNNKLFCFPFSYVYVTNNAGIDSTFRYEDFNGNPKFMMAGALGQGCTIKLCPVSYKKYTDNTEVFEYGLSGAKYPICAWSSDYYTNWVTQNAVNTGLSLASGFLSAGVNASYNNYTGAAGNLLSSVGGVMAQRYQAKVHPDQAKGNTNGSDILIGWERYFTADCMSVRYEIARTIDNFFSMFGYKVNRLKVPNITGRRNWNYVKTVGCYIEADIPQDDLQEIKDMFNNGVTFWHNPSTFADYSQNNDII